MVERGADLVDVGAVGADGLMQRIAGDTKLLRPVGDIRGQLGVDLLGIVRSLGVFLVRGVRGVLFRDLLVLVFGQLGFLSCLVGG